MLKTEELRNELNKVVDNVCAINDGSSDNADVFIEKYFEMIDKLADDEKFAVIVSAMLVVERYEDWFAEKMKEQENDNS